MSGPEIQRRILSYIDGYDPGLFPRDAEERYGVDQSSVVNLASNENPYPPPPPVLEAARKALYRANRYPDPRYGPLKDAISQYVGCPGKRIALGNGSTEILDMICKVFLDPFDRVVTTAPSYTMYALMGMLREATIEFVEVGGPAFHLNAEFLLDRSEGAKITFLCSPNNPTGVSIKKAELRKIVKGSSGMVVLDEAYSEFSGSSSVQLVAKYPNLIVARSMSKFFSLAGLRLGYAIATDSLVVDLEKTRLPFSISSAAEAAAIAALGEIEHFRARRDEIISERGRLFRSLAALRGIRPIRSDANFIMVAVDPPIRDLVGKLAQQGVLVRDLEGLTGLEGQHIRITVGAPGENEACLGALRAALLEA